jgi:hypothetical protein
VAVAANQIARTVQGTGGFGGSTPQHALRTTLGQAVAGTVGTQEHRVKSGFWVPRPTPSEAGDLPLPERFALHLGAPNPFRDRTEIRFDVPGGGGEVRIDLFDVVGRHVRTLVDGPASPGRQVVVWDRRDDRGNAVGLGIYLCRMDAPHYTETRKLVVTN